MLDGFVVTLQRALGTEPAGEKVLVDECRYGHMTFRFEIEPECLSCRPKLRFIFTEFSGTGAGGGTSQSFAWTVSSDAYSDLNAMTTRILASIQQDAKRQDVRGWIGRWWDRLNRVRYVNHVPAVAEQFGPQRHWIHATLREDRHGVMVCLGVEYQGRSTLSVRVPLKSLQRLHDGLEAIRAEAA